MSDYYQQSQSYRRGFVEGQSGERNAYLLLLGATDVSEYERGYCDGCDSVKETEERDEDSTG